jgi:hypothetical protein
MPGVAVAGLDAGGACSPGHDDGGSPPPRAGKVALTSLAAHV